MGCVGWPASCNGGDYETLNNESLDARQGPHLTPAPFCSTCRVYVRDGIGSPRGTMGNKSILVEAVTTLDDSSDCCRYRVRKVASQLSL